MATNLADTHIERVFSVTEDKSSVISHDLPDHVIAKSWSRCIDRYELIPSTPHDTKVVETSDLNERQQRMGALLKIASNECDILYDEIGSSGYAVILSDSEGIIVYHVSDPTLQKSFNKAGLWFGADWSEASEGTNGIGTCLLEGQAVTVHLDDHFHTYNTPLSCSGVPIHDVFGNRIAALDVSTVNSKDSKNTQWHTAKLLKMSANQIENSHFLNHYRNEYVLCFHSRAEFVGLLSEALLAIDENGKILACNAPAVTMLGCKSRTELTARNIDEVLNLTAETLDMYANHIPDAAWPILDKHYGQRFFCLLKPPTKTIVNNKIKPSITETNQTSLSVPDVSSNKLDCMDLDNLVGSDENMAHNAKCAKRLADKAVTILLCGETGTGKEAFARAMHNASQRKDKPFIAVNCAAIPESLIESELFGYKHGAFTGASREGMPGCIQQSNGGTLFLDEIGDMPSPLQTRLLRVLEEKEVRPLGSQTSIPVDLHVISATNANLKDLVDSQQFREDLYYRLNGMILTLPALRERSDLEKLLYKILTIENDTGNTIRIEKNAYQHLKEYRWPGNIREMRNVLRTTIALSDNEIITLDDLPANIAHPNKKTSIVPQEIPDNVLSITANEKFVRKTPLHEAERDIILEELTRNHWCITSTAKQLDISRSTLYRKLNKYGISASRGK